MAKISQMVQATTIDGTEQMLGVQGGVTKRFASALLKGVKGDTGPTGATGPAGAIGPQGPAGADSTVPGPQGTQGIQGPAGVDGLDGDVPEAPEDGKQYVRKDGAWVEVAAGSGHTIVDENLTPVSQRASLRFTVNGESEVVTIIDYLEENLTSIDIPWPYVPTELAAMSCAFYYDAPDVTYTAYLGVETITRISTGIYRAVSTNPFNEYSTEHMCAVCSWRGGTAEVTTVNVENSTFDIEVLDRTGTLVDPATKVNVITSMFKWW